MKENSYETWAHVVVTVLTLTSALVAPSELGQGAAAQQAGEAWTPPRLADGQPDIEGMLNNTDAVFTPLELPEELLGGELTPTELQERAEARGSGRIEGSEWRGHENSRGVGGYGTYWFDWYFDKPVAVGAPALIVEPANGRIPKWLENAQKLIDMNATKLHDVAENMEAGDRCISRGVVGIMMPTEYNNGTLILQPPGYVVIHSEMIHNARIIPVDDTPHVDDRVKQWEGDPRGRWEGNTLVIESTNFRAVKNIRGPAPGTRSIQTEKQKLVERLTAVGPDAIHYSITIDDPETYTEPWTAAFPYRRDREYLQFEYACHEGNYSVPNALGGARIEAR